MFENKEMRKLTTDIFRASFSEEFKKNFVKNKLKIPTLLTETEIKRFSNYLSNQKRHKDTWEFIDNKLKTLYKHYNQNPKKLIRNIFKTVKDKGKERKLMSCINTLLKKC